MRFKLNVVYTSNLIVNKELSHVQQVKIKKKATHADGILLIILKISMQQT